MKPFKHVAAIHDISGYGKCSLTVVLPILSAAGVTCSVMPTAVLSTYTGVFEGYTYRDLTEDIPAFSAHWRKIGLRFDALYSGFLGSFEQIDLVLGVFDDFKRPDNLILVDPVMADNGKLYSVYSPNMVQGMKKLCKKADIITPNMTEAAFLLDEDYHEGPYQEPEILRICRKLAQLGPGQVVLTGVHYKADELGAACYESTSDRLEFYSLDSLPGYYHGTGDVFCSVLLSGLLNGFPLCDAASLAVDFVHQSIRNTVSSGIDPKDGVDFEHCLPDLIDRLK